LDGVNSDADRRDVRTRHRYQRRDDAGRLRVLDDPLLGNLFDDADAFLPQRVAQNAEHLGAPLRLGAAHAALGDAHLRELRGRLLVAAGPRDGAAQSVDGGLVVVVDGAHRGAGACEQILRDRLFRLRDGSWVGDDRRHGYATSSGTGPSYSTGIVIRIGFS